MLRPLALLLALAPFSALATPGNVVQRIDDRHDIHNDRVDRARLVTLVDEWHAARDANNSGAERAADQGIRQWLQQELAESRHEVAEARSEVAHSQAEIGRERAERRVDIAQGDAAGRRDTTHDVRDDRMDRREDQVDAGQARADLGRTRAIADQLAAMQPAFENGNATPAQYAEKSRLLRELQQLARAEVREDREEIREDAGERREDFREHREVR
jgi:hypothetical protein